MRRSGPSLISIFAFLLLLVGIPATIVAINLGFNPFVFANPTEAPSELVVANITETSATISFLTPSAPTDALIRLGTSPTNLTQITADSRDLSSGQSGTFVVHMFEVTNLSPGTEYHFTPVIGGTTYNDGNAPYSFETFTTPDTPAVPNPKYGTLNPTAAGAIVRVHAVSDGSLSTPASALTADNGTFTFDAGVLRTQNGEPFDLTGAEMIAVAATENGSKGGVQFDASTQPGRIQVTENSGLSYDQTLTSLPSNSGSVVTPTFTTADPTTAPDSTTTPTTTTVVTPTPTFTAGTGGAALIIAPYNSGLEQTDSSAPYEVFISNISVNGFNVNWLTKEPTTGSVLIPATSDQYLDIRDSESQRTARYTHSVAVSTVSNDPGDLIEFQIAVNDSTFTGTEDFSFEYTVPSIPDSPPTPSSLEGSLNRTYTPTDTSDVLLASQSGDGDSTFRTIVPSSTDFSISTGDMLTSDLSGYYSGATGNFELRAYGEYNSSAIQTASDASTAVLTLEPGLSFSEIRQNRTYNSPPAIAGTAPPGSTVLISLNQQDFTVTAGSDGNWQLSDLSGLTAGRNTISASAAGEVVSASFDLELELLPNTAIEDWTNILIGGGLVLIGFAIKRLITLKRYYTNQV